MVAALAVMVQAAPSILIVHLRPPKGVPSTDLPICDFLATELLGGGKVVPICWNIADPVFRAAIEKRKIQSVEGDPTMQEALSAAGKLDADYVLAADVRIGDGAVLGAAYLYKGGRLIWKYPDLDPKPELQRLKSQLKSKAITKEEYDEKVLMVGLSRNSVQVGSRFGAEDTAHAMARTWAEMLATGPLLSLQREAVKTTPDPLHGQAPAVDPSSDEDIRPKNPEDDKWKGLVANALKAGDTSMAVSILRDAIDTAPLDVARRMQLIKVLMHSGRPEVAASEARRAAELMPEHVELRTMAARCWIRAGNTEEAQSDLNEAVSHAPDSAETRRLLAEIAIAKDDLPGAIGNLDKAISVAPSGDAYYLRALAQALAGNSEKAAADTKSASDAGLSKDPQDAEERYSLVATMFDGALVAIGGEIRTLHQKAQVQRNDKEVQSTYAEMVKRVTCRSQFIAGLPIPNEHSVSHNRWVLAYKLLAQCLTDLNSYLTNGSEDALTDSRINLGEALRQGVTARQTFKEEQQGTKSNAKSG